ncbi:unnamed protein product [Ilex paraguariensis]|uniref:XPG-I domain-containing protein n=1 Tax=Ilex paraguariensis TaxID=185542 RepID=A0ABC8T1U5_9AQUA
MGSEFSCMIKEAKVLGMALGIACLDGIEEAEAQCALLNSESLCDGCFTSDSDVLLFGARTVYRDICLGEGGYVVCYEMGDIERILGFGRNSLIALAVLLGSDYSQGVHGLGPESACQIVKSAGDGNVLQRIASEGLSFARKPKGSKKQGNEPPSQQNDQFMQVIKAYLTPKCHSADSDAVHSVLATRSFQRSRLQQICTQYFEWPPEKTDEYILPKIAERDLRRFSNLRATSSELGVRLSLDEMPVKCPISQVVKHRKVQGRDCFEVSWEEMDGLKTSVVSADLVKRACPEKILGFEERIAQGKKPNYCRRRPKKSENKVSANEIDLKLQKLLLVVEQESTAICNVPSSRGTISEKTSNVTHNDLMNEAVVLNPESENNIKRNATTGCSSTTSIVAETEIIDLMSPSPTIHARGVSKCQEPRCTDVIDLSESEPDTSPEHARKARELRLFLASIREDIS